MSEDRIAQILQLVATIIAIGVIAGTLAATSRKYGGTIPGMVARILKWAARWLTNLATQYDLFLKNWRSYVAKNPIVMQCEAKEKPPAVADFSSYAKVKTRA